MNAGLLGFSSAAVREAIRRYTSLGGILVGTGGSDRAEQLPVGTDGQVLTANSSAQYGVDWETPSAGFANPMTTEGDIIYEHSGVPTRLAVGGIDTLLTSDGTDPAWSAAPTVLGEFTALDFATFGKPGATAATRYVGATTSGAPASGTFAKGDFIVTQDGHVFICTTAGTPGTWTDAGSVSNLVTSVFSRTGAVTATSGDYTAAQVTNAADKSSGSQQNFTGEVKSPDFVAGGLTGATAASRYVGSTASGAPGSGTFAVGDFVIDQTGYVWICTGAGTPGTWAAGGFHNPLTTHGDLLYENSTPAPAALAIGTTGQRLGVASSQPAWVDDIIDVNFIIDGGGATITTGMKGYLHIGQALTIVEASLLADQSGSIVVNIYKCTYTQFDSGSTHPVSGDKITSSTPPTISSATKVKDTTLSSWTTSISADDVLAFNVDSVTTIQRVTCRLKTRKAS